MRKIDERLGKVYEKDGFFYLEKIYNDLYDLIIEERSIKNKAIENGFVVHDSKWIIKENPELIIENIIYEGDKDMYNENIFVFKVKLEYMK
tara:strand:- start:803 stop:1075 length:273 start_codon:yes stop_codon:yes gene_type:complete